MELPIYQCKICKLVITGKNEKEVKQKSKKIYNKDYWDQKESEKSIESNYTDENSLILKKRWKSQINYCKPQISSIKSVLEIGSGSGQALSSFQKTGYDIIGLEPDARNVDLINQKFNYAVCHCGYAEDFILTKKFDLIWLSHTLEHTITPDILFKKMKSMLNPKGLLFIEVPNCDNLNILNQSIHENPSTFHFTMDSLKKLGEKSDLKLIKADYFSWNRTFQEKYHGFLQKFSHKKYTVVPFHFSKESDKMVGADLRMLFMKQ